MCRSELKHVPVRVKACVGTSYSMCRYEFKYGTFPMNSEDCINISTVVPYNLDQIHIGFISNNFIIIPISQTYKALSTSLRVWRSILDWLFRSFLVPSTVLQGLCVYDWVYYSRCYQLSVTLLGIRLMLFPYLLS